MLLLRTEHLPEGPEWLIELNFDVLPRLGSPGARSAASEKDDGSYRVVTGPHTVGSRFRPPPCDARPVRVEE
jgi:hypothetical protein